MEPDAELPEMKGDKSLFENYDMKKQPVDVIAAEEEGNDDDGLDDDDVVDDDEDGFPDGPLDKRMDDASLLSIASTKLLSVASSRNDARQVCTFNS